MGGVDGTAAGIVGDDREFSQIVGRKVHDQCLDQNLSLRMVERLDKLLKFLNRPERSGCDEPVLSLHNRNSDFSRQTRRDDLDQIISDHVV